MKKTILFFALTIAISIANAQTSGAVDAHAGHNHGAEATVSTKAAVVAPTAVIANTKKATKNKVKASKLATNNVPTIAPTAAITSNTSNTMISEVPVAMPDALIAKELEFDFGKIPQGKPVTHIFAVTNSGKTAFKLDNVAASCGCTTPEWDREKVLDPGTTANITVGFNAGAAGPFTKPVTITYNGTQTKVLNIKGEVYATPATPAPANAEILEIKK